MSGGYWNYKNDYLKEEIFFPQDESGETYYEPDPLEDKFMSDLLHDTLTALHVYDWYKSSDTSEQTYRMWVKEFLIMWKDKFADLDI